MKPLIAFLSCSLITVACKNDMPPQPTPSTIQLAFEDASCTEAWLKATTTEVPATVRLLRDGQRVSDFRLLPAPSGTSDSLLLDEGLLPRRSYVYQLQKLNADSSVVETSASVQVTTMDTTSHNFTWQIDTLGIAGSTLYDVAIINDTLAYAVGEIYLRDSTGQLDPILYNLAKWNGRSWKIVKVLSDCRLYYPNCGPVFFTPSPGKTVYAFAPNDIWIVAGGVHHFDGTRWVEQRAVVEIGGTNKMWGSNSRDLWFVGNGGLIIHYDGSLWQRVESGTTVDIRDVYGGQDRRTGELEAYAVASAQESFDRRILRILPSVSTMTDSGLLPYGRLGGVWFIPGTIYFVVGDGVYSKHGIRTALPWKHHARITPYYTPSVRGNQINNVMVTGVYGELLHFNGSSWFSFRANLGIPFAVLGSVAVKSNLVIIVGFDGGRGVAIIGRR